MKTKKLSKARKRQKKRDAVKEKNNEIIRKKDQDEHDRLINLDIHDFLREHVYNSSFRSSCDFKYVYFNEGIKLYENYRRDYEIYDEYKDHKIDKEILTMFKGYKPMTYMVPWDDIWYYIQENPMIMLEIYDYHFLDVLERNLGIYEKDIHKWYNLTYDELSYD